MKAKKIISGIIIIGMTFGLTGISFAGRKGDHRNNDRQVVKVDKHQNRHAVKKVDKRHARQADRIYHGKKSRVRYHSRHNRHYNQRMKHGDRYYSRNDRYNTNDRYQSRNYRHETDRRNPPHVNKQRRKDNNTHLKLRTIVTPFGIFPVIW